MAQSSNALRWAQATLFPSTVARVTRWLALPVAARRMGLRPATLIDAARAHRIPAKLQAGCRWFFPSSVCR